MGRNYDETYFYKIVCRDANIKDCYVGHTTNFIKRKYQHKKNSVENTQKGKLYNFINENKGWDNFEMMLMEKRKCENVIDARNIEREFIKSENATLNMNIPNRTPKEYRFDNKEKIAINHKEYYADNQEYFIQKASQYYKDNREKMIEAKHRYYENNKDKFQEWYEKQKESNYEQMLQRKRDYYYKNKEQLLEKVKQYAADNREKVLLNKRNYYYKNKERLLEKCSCECGGYYIRTCKLQHTKTKKHQLYIEQLQKV